MHVPGMDMFLETVNKEEGRKGRRQGNFEWELNGRAGTVIALVLSSEAVCTCPASSRVVALIKGGRTSASQNVPCDAIAPEAEWNFHEWET